jgi:glycosyltransferase involved in cell wall biosynthesis
MLNKYAISVIVPTYNRAKLLDHTLRSLALQDLPRDAFEVIVADDGSFDNTRKIVDSYEGKMNLKYVFQEDKGYRPASSRNNGIKVSQGDICLFIDSGVLLDDHCLAAHINFHRNASSPVAAIGYVYGFDQEGADQEKLEAVINVNDPSGTIRSFKQKNFAPDVREPHYIKYNDRIENLPAPWIFFWTCNVSVRRKYLLEAGMFDESYDGNWGCEDNDLGVRLQELGIRVTLNRKALSIHYPHYKDMEEKAAQGYANCVFFHNKFNTLETELFLKNYIKNLTNEFVDINAMIYQTIAL